MYMEWHWPNTQKKDANEVTQMLVQSTNGVNGWQQIQKEEFKLEWKKEHSLLQKYVCIYHTVRISFWLKKVKGRSNCGLNWFVYIGYQDTYPKHHIMSPS